MPGLRGAAVKEYFLRYEETRLQRLRDDEGRAADRAARLRHQRVEHHLRRHRDRHQHRRAAAPGPPVPGGRRRLPGQLRRRADRRADGQDRRRRAGQRRHREPARGPAAGVVPRGRVRHRRPGHRAALGRRPARVDQRRLLRAARRRSSTSCTRARTWSATRSRGWPRCAACRRSRTTGSGRRWTRSRSAASSRSSTGPARSRGRCGATRPARSRRPDPAPAHCQCGRRGAAGLEWWRSDAAVPARPDRRAGPASGRPRRPSGRHRDRLRRHAAQAGRVGAGADRRVRDRDRYAGAPGGGPPRGGAVPARSAR